VIRVGGEKRKKREKTGGSDTTDSTISQAGKKVKSVKNGIDTTAREEERDKGAESQSEKGVT